MGQFAVSTMFASGSGKDEENANEIVIREMGSLTLNNTSAAAAATGSSSSDSEEEKYSDPEDEEDFWEKHREDIPLTRQPSVVLSDSVGPAFKRRHVVPTLEMSEKGLCRVLSDGRGHIQMTWDVFCTLQKYLEENKMSVLYVERVKLGGFLESLTTALQKNKSLESLVFSECDLKDEDVKKITDVLKDGHLNLRDLEFISDPLSFDVVGDIIEVLEKNPELNKLSLSGSKIGDKGVEEIVKFFTDNQREMRFIWQ